MSYRIVWGKTVWWENDWKPGHKFRMRSDYFLGLHRVYSRELKQYIWKIIIGKLQIAWWIK